MYIEHTCFSLIKRQLVKRPTLIQVAYMYIKSNPSPIDSSARALQPPCRAGAACPRVQFSVESEGESFKVLCQAYIGVCTKLIQVMK